MKECQENYEEPGPQKKVSGQKNGQCIAFIKYYVPGTILGTGEYNSESNRQNKKQKTKKQKKSCNSRVQWKTNKAGKDSREPGNGLQC